MVGLVVSSLLVYRQVNLRSKAATLVEGATLSLASGATSGVKPGDVFDVIVNLAQTGGASYKITAASVVLNYPQDKFTLVSITPGAFFLTSYNSATTEMLNKPDITTAGVGKLAIGVPCTISAPWVCYPSSAATGQVATFRFQVKSAAAAGSATISFDNATAVAALDSAGNAVPTSILLGTTPVNITINPPFECTTDANCAADKKCTNNSCVAVVCPTTIPGACKTYQVANHTCNTVNNTNSSACVQGLSDSIVGGVCFNGDCICSTGLNNCSGTCKNLQIDASNCGTCGHACATGQSCSGAVCITPPDTIPPAVSLTSPTNGQTVSGAITFSANATDNVGVTKVEFLVDNQVVATDTTDPYFLSQSSAGLANGAHLITAKAYDATNNVTTSTPAVSITVSNCTPTTCVAAGKNCGSIPDGCGGTLSCGTCTGGQTCTSGVCTNPAASTLTFGFKLLQNNNTVARTADVLLKSTAQTLSFTNIALTGTSGVFSPTTPITLTGVTVGTSYDILVKSPGYLRKKLGTITVTTGANTGSWTPDFLKAGDFDGNNILNAMDVGNILGLYNTISVPVTAATTVYDLDGNGVINALDVANTLANYTAISVSGDN